MITFLLIQACGYHLRSSGIDLPESLKSIYVQGASGQLKNNIKKVLRYSDAKLVKSKEAGMIIKIVKEKMHKNVISLSPTGRANEFELNYVLDFILLDSKGKELYKVQSVEINRDYFNDQEDVLAKNIEENVIRNEVYRQAAQSLINQSRIVLEKINNLRMSTE